MTMDLRAFRYFEEVVTAGSLRAAAERLNVAGSALSRRISLLETELGVVLFDRTRTGMTLTQAGEIYLRYARGAMLDNERVRAEIENLKGVRRGHIRVASVEGVVGDFVMEAISSFRAQFPAVTLELRVCGADLVAEAIKSCDSDIGIGANAFNQKGIKTVLRLPSPLLAVMAPKFLDHPGDKVRLADLLADHAVAVPDRTFAIRRQIEECAGGLGAPFSPVLVTNSIDALRAFARLGSGITFLPRLAARDDLARGRLVGVPLEDAALNESSIDLLTADDRQISPASSALLQCLTRTALRYDTRPSTRKLPQESQPEAAPA